MFKYYPIIDPLRFPLLILEWINAILFMELGIFLMLKYNKQPKLLKNSKEVGYSILFLGSSLLWLFNILADFYFSNTIRSLFLYIGIALFLPISLLSFKFIEKKGNNFPKYNLTISIFLIYAFFIFIIGFFWEEALKILTFASWSFSITLLCISILKQKIKIKEVEKKSNFFIKVIFFFVFLIIGGFFSLGLVMNSLGLFPLIFGAFIQLVSIIFLLNFFRKFSSTLFLNFRNLIEDIYILNNNGACLYHMKHSINSEKLNDHLVSGAISILDNMLKQLTQTKKKGFSTIKKEEKILNIYTSKFLTGVLFSKEESDYVQYYLEKVIKKIENVYRDILINWNGKTSIFSPIKDIIEDHLPD
ncbi:MAG: membrane protein of unknown function [Promethearchaeota archaeon]|nr:MAG: membrane protein of unknown function [Candidatus Lokiarchaeota archaeon]